MAPSAGKRSKWRPHCTTSEQARSWAREMSSEAGFPATSWRPLLWLAMLLLTGHQLSSLHLASATSLDESQLDRTINVRVGALLEESDHEQANMFIRTIKMINERRDETIRQLLNLTVTSDPLTGQDSQATPTTGLRFEPMIEFLGDRESALEADCKVCQLLESGSLALMGPTDGSSIQHVQSICDNLEVPYFELRPYLGSSPSPPSTAASAGPHSSLSSSPPSGRQVLPGHQGDSRPDHGRLAGARPIGAPATGGRWLEPREESLASRATSSSLSTLSPLAETTLADNLGQESRRLIWYLNGSVDDNGATQLLNPKMPHEQRHRQLFSIPSPGQSMSPVRLAQLANDELKQGGRQQWHTGAHKQQQQQQQPSPHAAGGQTAPSSGGNGRLEELTLNLYPPAHLLASAYIDLIDAWNWSSFAIVYEDGRSMIKLQDLFKESSGTWTSRWQIKLFQFRHHDSTDSLTGQSGSASGPLHEAPSSGAPGNYDSAHNSMPVGRQAGNGNGDSENGSGHYNDSNNNNNNSNNNNNANANNNSDDNAPGSSPGVASMLMKRRRRRHSFRDIFWRIKTSGETNVLLDVATENLYDALKQAQQVGCMTEHFSYLLTSLDLHTIDLEDFKYSRTRITAFNLIQVAKSQPNTNNINSSAERRRDSAGLPERNNHNNTARHGRARHVRQTELPQQPPLPPPRGFDERYLEKLGVHVIPSQAAAETQVHSSSGPGASGGETATSGSKRVVSKHRLSPSVVLERTGGPNGYLEPPGETLAELAKREQLQSLPASMGLLPTVDRDHEQRLYEFFIEQLERNLSSVRLSTASAILHDSLLLYALGLRELDPNGHLLSKSDQRSASDMNNNNQTTRSPGDLLMSEPLDCSLESRPWPHGSSLVNYMRRLTFHGLTGQISFDQHGLRSDFKLDVLGVAPEIGLIKVGEWYSKKPPGSGSGRESSSWSYSSSSTSKAAGSVATRRPYDELSRHYEAELRRYSRLVNEGAQIQVPLTRTQSRHGELLINEIIFERLYREQSDQIDTLIVTTKLSQPYFMLKETPNKLEGNDQYEGFAVDLIHELSKLVNFRYRWREVADKKYGSKELLPNGTVVWNGMIGEIVRGQADLAIVDLTITAQREEAVDFTLPFMNTGISILFKKPTTKVTTLFSFLSPFSSDVWAYVLAAYCGISANLFLVGHLSPYEWADPHPCRHNNSANNSGEGGDDDEADNESGDQVARCDSEDDMSENLREAHKHKKFNNNVDAVSAVARRHAYLSGQGEMRRNTAPHLTTTTITTSLLKNQFTMLNSFWFTIGSLMQQGSDLTPRSMSTRTIAGIWYFFTLIMISSYTANLAAFLTVEKVVYPIENVKDLSQQDEIKYGCVESGSTCTFFHDSQIDTYQAINRTMSKFRTYVRSNDEGQKRVEEGKFAFFMESASIEYIVERNCNLTQIGGLLDSKGYGLATSKKSRLKRPYRTLLSEGILHLQETGMLHVLKNRWWKERRGGGTCTDDGKGSGVTELSLANVGGVFVVLLGGLGISFLVAIAEFMWKARRKGSTRDRMCEEMMSDLKFALACKRSTKPVGGSMGAQAQHHHRGGSGSGSNNNNKNSSTSSTAVASNLAVAYPHSLGHQPAKPGHANATPACLSAYEQSSFGSFSLPQLPAAPSGKVACAASTAIMQPIERPLTSSMPAPVNVQAAYNMAGGGGGASSSSKACNPVLMHAMLTMLMQQQQQQQQHDQHHHQQQDECDDANCLHRALTYSAQPSEQLAGGAQRHRMATSASLTTKRDTSHMATGGISRRHQFTPDSQVAAGDEQWRAPIGANSAAHHHQGTWQKHTNEAAGKRRLLFAQQTIDTTDDSLVLQGMASAQGRN